MRRRVFIQKCGVLPLLAMTGVSGEASTLDRCRAVGDYCYDGTFAEFELVLGYDLSQCLLESTQLLASFVQNVERERKLFREGGWQMPGLSIQHPGDFPLRSVASREYRIVVLGVEVYSNIVSSDFPLASQHRPQAVRRQLEQIYHEVLRVNESHQGVWYTLNPPVIPEYNPITGKTVCRN